MVFDFLQHSLCGCLSDYLAMFAQPGAFWFFCDVSDEFTFFCFKVAMINSTNLTFIQNFTGEQVGALTHLCVDLSLCRAVYKPEHLCHS